MKKKLLILNNIGSPASTSVSDVRRYLREFLMDPFVIQIPFLFRFLLVYGIISLFRPAKSAEKYKTIWTSRGSPLLSLTLDLKTKLLKHLEDFDISLGMRYQNPSLQESISNLPQYDSIYLAPLYPQYAESSTLSSTQKFISEIKILSKKNSIPLTGRTIKVLKPFWKHPLFIETWTQKFQFIDLTQYDLLLFSYHGLPESQLAKNHFCQFNPSCCLNSDNADNNCYRAQCFQTTNLILNSLKKSGKLPPQLKVETSFQSRLGRSKWIEPYTDIFLKTAAQENQTKRILVLCPAFVTDCLETLEEIKIENKKLFLEHGGLQLDYVSSLNDEDYWAKNLSLIIKDESSFDTLTIAGP